MRSHPADPRRLLLDAFAAALAAVEPRAATARALAEAAPGPLRVIAAGKAAEGMLRAVLHSRAVRRAGRIGERHRPGTAGFGLTPAFPC